MRKLLVSVVIATLVAAASLAQEKKEPAKNKPAAAPKVSDEPAVTLKVGDPAPPLKASKWLQGDEVKGFASGKTYVVEFWATWCGPCIVMMPHMAEMQAQYKEKGVTFIGYTAEGPNNGEAKVAAFVKKRGPKLKYTFAYGDDQKTNDAWMEASGQRGIPCSFVVDKEGKIAFIGHPMYLGVALPKILEGTWKGPNELDGLEKEINGAFEALEGRDAEAALKALAEFESRRPALAKVPYFIGPKIALLLKAKKGNEARMLAGEAMERTIKQEDPMPLQTVSIIMRTKAAKEDKECLALSMKAAEALLATEGDKDVVALFNMAQAQFAAGDKAKAKEFGQKAIDAADSEGTKKSLERRIKEFDAEMKPESK